MPLRRVWDSLQRVGFGLCIFDDALRLIAVNDPFCDLFGAAGERLQYGTSLSQFVRELIAQKVVRQDDEETWIAECTDALRSGTTLQLKLSDGRICKLVTTLGHESGLTLVAEDVTRTQYSEETLREAKEFAEKANIMKSRFLRAANHDLRQPLATMKILVYNCMSVEDPEARSQALRSMDLTVSVMEELLGALLNVGQLDAGAIVPRVASFPVATLFKRLGVQFIHQAEDKGLNLTIVPTSCHIATDQLLLERILANFLSNAIRYTDYGRILLGCRRIDNKLRIEVYDTGRGIAPEHHERIFDEFFRINTGGSHSERTALGLGLNVAKRLSQLLETPISLRSAPGRGSVFSITVPIGDIWRSEVGQNDITEALTGEFVGVEALIVEDDSVLRDALSTLLDRWGIIVHAAGNYDQALQMAAEKRPDLVISDFQLPGGSNGLDVCRSVQTALGEEIPCIIVTADTDERRLAEISAAGLPLLIKPIAPARLRVLMHHVLFEENDTSSDFQSEAG